MMHPDVIEPGTLAPAGAESLWHRVALTWEHHLAGKSPRTREEYRRWLRHYLASIGGDPGNATPDNVHTFAHGSRDGAPPPSPSTATVRLAALRSFYQCARLHGAIASNPVDDMRAQTGPQRSRPPRPKGLTPDQLRALLAAIPDTPAGTRDRATIVTAVLTGLRRSELFSLTAGSLAEHDGIVYYTVRTKGGEERTRELPRPAYVAVRHALARLGTPLDTLPPDAPLFPVKPGTFATMLGRHARRAGLEHVTPHTLRHSAAKIRERTGQSVTDIQTFLGHRSLDTTSRYLARLVEQRDPGWQGVAAALGIDGEERRA